MLAYRIPNANSGKYAWFDDNEPPVNATEGFVVQYDEHYANGVLRVTLYSPHRAISSYLTYPYSPTNTYGSECFRITPVIPNYTSKSGFDYVFGDFASDEPRYEPLEQNWWLYSAARYYRDVLRLSPHWALSTNPVAAILLSF